MKKFLYFLLSVVFSGCYTSENVDNNIKFINVTPKSEATVKLSEIADTVMLIVPETSQNSVVGEITKMHFTDSCLYVLAQNCLFKFNANGDFVSKIDKKGVGPDEYIHINDFAISDNGAAVIFSRSDKCFLEYDWNQNLLSKTNIETWGCNFTLTSSGNYLLYNGNEVTDASCHKIMKVSKNGAVEAEYIENDVNRAKYLHVISPSHFNDSKNFFFEDFNDTVYYITDDKILPKYYVDFGNLSVPSSVFESDYNNIMEFFQTINNHAYARGISGFIETDKNFVVAYVYDKCNHLSVVSKKDETVNDATVLIEDSQLNGFPINLADFPPISISDNCMVIAIDPSLVKAYADTLTPEQRDLLISRLSEISDEQNSIILKIKFK